MKANTETRWTDLAKKHLVGNDGGALFTTIKGYETIPTL